MPIHKLLEIEHPLFYIQNVVSPLLHPYVDTPELVWLDWQFLAHLRQSTLASGKVPISRRADWSYASANKDVKDTAAPFGYFVNDYNEVPLPESFRGRMRPPRRLSVEIKPKAGYLAFSPLVHPLHRAKFVRSRFSLLQILHQQGQVKKAWNDSLKPTTMSHYEPLDLFSGDKTCTQRAISNMLSCPQNNLKVWYNKTPLVNHKLTAHDTDPDVKEMLTTILCNAKQDNHHAGFHALMESILVTILCHETILPKLLQLQELDILDADGAIVVFDRLVSLCNGSVETAVDLLKNYRMRATGSENVHQIVASSPFALGGDCSRTLKLCEETEGFRKILRDYNPNMPQSRLLDQFRDEVLGIAEGLTSAECCFLLSNWLLSLAMCDVSIFISLEQIICSEDSVTQIDEGSSSKAMSAIEMGIQEGQPGVIAFCTNGCKARFAYNVRVIDCDQKPAAKLKGRKEKEEAFRQLEFQFPGTD